MSTITLDVQAFRALFPAFMDGTKYNTVRLDAVWGLATSYISDQNCGYLKDQSRAYALQLMLAHLLYIQDQAATGQTPGVMTGATIDKISVTLQPPPERSQFAWWLNQSPYGQQLLALLNVKSVGGWQVGGAPESLPLRRIW